MTEAPLPLKLVGGDPSLDFVNTVDWTSHGTANERLTGYERLVEWGSLAGLLDRSEESRLSRIAGEHPHAAARAFANARSARRVLQRLFRSIAEQDPSSAALEQFNRLRRRASPNLSLDPSFEWRARRADDLDLVLWKVARSAEVLLRSGEIGMIRICGGAGCGWMYVDRSRNGLRRWCEMETCGTRAKSIRRAARRHAAKRRG